MELLKRNSQNFLVIFLLAVSLQLSSLSYRFPALPKAGWNMVSFFVSPVQKLFHESLETSKFIWSKYLWLQGISERARLLELEVQDLKSERAKLLEYHHENNRLANLLAFKSEAQQQGIVANVIGRDPSNWSMTVTIDKGIDDGISEGCPVVDGNGLVGRISNAAGGHSTVLLLIDPSSSVGALSQDSRISGMIEGTFSSDSMKLNFVENSPLSEIIIGDRIITSGLDSVFPKGIYIGEVREVKNSTNSLFQDILVRSSVNFRKLETVMVLINQK